MDADVQTNRTSGGRSAAIDPETMGGTWSITRELVDEIRAERGTFSGTLTISPDEAGLRWQESGTLTWDGSERPASRRLGLRRIDGQWWMTFGDGGPFHPWMFDAPLTHLCGADVYRGTVTRPDPADVDRVRIEWFVTGPKKNQHITTWLRRRASS
jgi:hypothetical protein